MYIFPYSLPTFDQRILKNPDHKMNVALIDMAWLFTEVQQECYHKAFLKFTLLEVSIRNLRLEF